LDFKDFKKLYGKKIKSGRRREGSGWSRHRPGGWYGRPWYRRVSCW